MILVFGVRLLKKSRVLPLGRKKSIGLLMAAFVCSVGVVLAVNRANMYLPDLLGTNIVYGDEQWKTNLSAEEMAKIEAMVPGYSVKWSIQVSWSGAWVGQVICEA